MMVLIRALAIVLVGVGAGALHHHFGPDIDLSRDIGANEPLPEPAGDAAPATEGPDTEAPETLDTEQDPEPPLEDDDGAPPDPPARDVPALTYNDLEEHVELAGAVLIFDMAMNGEAGIVDARRADEYAAGHIPLALNLRPAQFQGGNVPEEAMYLDPEWPILIYCQGGDCDDSISVARSLRDMGFKRLHIFDDGYPAWVDAGHEIERGGP